MLHYILTHLHTTRGALWWIDIRTCDVLVYLTYEHIAYEIEFDWFIA